MSTSRTGSINHEYLQESDHSTTCLWKGKASYDNVVVDADTDANAA